MDVPLDTFLAGFAHLDASNVNISGSEVRLNGIAMTVEVEKLTAGGTNASNSVFLIRSTATHGSPSQPELYQRQRVEITTYPVLNQSSNPTSMFATALACLTGFGFGGNAHTDSWHSDHGGYQNSNPGNKGDLVSEGNVTVQKIANVLGTAHSNQNLQLPTFDYDSFAADYLPTSRSAITSSETLNSGVYEVSELSPGSNSTLNVNGEVVLFVDGPINLHKASINYQTADSNLVIFQSDYDGEGVTGADSFVAGNTVLGPFDSLGKQGGKIASATVDPSRFQLYTAHDGAIRFSGNSTIAGVIYAPEAQFHLTGTADVFGSLIAGSFNSDQIVGSFYFHYDEALADADKFPTFNDSQIPTMVIGAWRTTQLGYGAP